MKYIYAWSEQTDKTRSSNNSYRVWWNISTMYPNISDVYWGGTLYKTDGNGNISFTYNSWNDDMRFAINIWWVLYKTNASDSNKINYIWAVNQDTLFGATTKIETSGTVNLFTGLTDGSKYYLSNTPWGISLTPGTNSIEFWTASWSTWITIMQWYYNDVESNFIIDISWEGDGNKNIYAKVNDWIENSTAVLLTIEKDTTAPTLSEITPVSTYTNDTTPSYTFNTTETGSISYSGSCSSVQQVQIHETILFLLTLYLNEPIVTVRYKLLIRKEIYLLL
jgi:hypothetical protein